MEIELKYLLRDNLAKDRILNDKHLLEIKDSSCDETIQMKAVYFDTEEGNLRRLQIALRARFENEKVVVTLKWKGSAQDGLHVRGELNVPSDIGYLEHPTVDIFKGSEIYDELLAAVSDKKLMPVMEMDYVRKAIQVDTGKSISVVSLDEGTIHTSNGDDEILEERWSCIPVTRRIWWLWAENWQPSIIWKQVIRANTRGGLNFWVLFRIENALHRI